MSLTRNQVKGEQVLLRASEWLGHRCAYWLCVPGSDQEGVGWKSERFLMKGLKSPPTRKRDVRTH